MLHLILGSVIVIGALFAALLWLRPQGLMGKA